MSLKKNLLLLVVLLIAGSAYYLVDVKWAREKAADKERKAQILRGIDPKLLLRISLDRKKESYQIIRTDNGWRFVKPVSAPLDKEEMENLLKLAAGLKEHRRIGTVTQRADFGLETPGYKLTFGLKGQEEVVFLVGARTPTRVFRYASLKDGAVFTVLSEDFEKFNRPVFELRDRAVLPVPPAKAKKVVIRSAGDPPFAVVRKGEEKWEMISPVKVAASASESEGVVLALNYGKVHRFVDESPKDLAPYGLDSPSYTVRVYMDKEEKVVRGLHLGKYVMEPDPRSRDGKKIPLFYARRLSGGPVFLVGPDVIKDFPRKPFQLREKIIIDYDVDNVQRLRIELPGETIEALRKDLRTWSMTAKRGEAAAVPFVPRRKYIEDVLWDAKWTNATGFMDAPGADLAKYGLTGKDVRRIKLWIREKKDGPEVQRTLTIGPPQADGKIYLQRDQEKRLYTISRKDFDKLARDGFYLSERRIVPFESLEEIARVRLSFPDGKKAVVIRDSKDDWVFETPKNQGIVIRKVNRLLLALQELEFEGEAKKGVSYDTKKFRVRVLLETRKGKKLGPILFAGGGTKELMFVGRGAEKKVLGVQRENIEKILPFEISDWFLGASGSSN
ncbi:MAG: DUF4340 domain-containing protein [bacterium]|nr:DUF4340 domain-containing protein [bacterium]